MIAAKSRSPLFAEKTRQILRLARFQRSEILLKIQRMNQTLVLIPATSAKHLLRAVSSIPFALWMLFTASLLAPSSNARAQSITSGALDVPGEVDEFSFSPTDPGLFHLDVQTPQNNFSWSLRGPFGVISDRNSFNASDSPNSAIFQLNPGEHRISIRSFSGETGAYAFRLTPLPSGPVLLPGVTNPISLVPASGAAHLQFTPQPGERFRLSLPARSNLNSVAAWILDPLGNPLANASFGSPSEFVARMGLPHSIVVNGGVRNTGNGTGSVLLTLLGQAPLYPDAPTLILGEAQSLPTGPAFTNLYRFHLPSNTTLWFDVIGASGNDRWRLDGPDGVGTEYFFQSSAPPRPAPAGEYLLRISRTSAAASAPSFILRDLSGQPSVTPGNSFSLTHQPAGASLFRRLPLVAGQRISLIAESFSGFTGGSPNWQVLAPDGQTLRIANQNFSGSFFDLPLFTAPVSGEYGILFDSTPSTDSTSATRSFRIETVVDELKSLVFGQEYSGDLPSIDGTVTFAFNLPTTRRLFIDPLASTNLSWRLIGPAGDATSGRFDFEAGSLLNLPAGDHRLLLSASRRLSPAYRFRVIDADAAPSLALGTAVTNLHLPGTAALLHRLNLNPGQRVIGRALARTGFPSEQPRWLLVDPTGRTLWNSSFSDTPVVVASAPGDHFLIVQGPSTTPTNGTTTVAVLPVPSREEPLLIDSPTVASITTPGESFTYRLRIDQPTRIHIDSLSDSNLRWNLSSTSRSIASASFSSFDLATYDLVPGDYRFTVESSGNNLGSASFRILSAQASTNLPLNTPVNLSLDPFSGSVFRRIQLTAGQTLYFDVHAVSPQSPAPWVALIDPFGNRLFQRSVADHGPFTVRSTGPHDLLVVGTSSAPEASGQLEFTLWSVPPVLLNHTPGSDFSGTLQTPGERQIHRWTSPDPGHFLFDTLTPGTDLNWSVSSIWGTASSGRTWTDGAPFFIPAGPASLQFDSNNDSTPDYRARLLNLTDAPILPIGAESTLPISPGSGATVRRIPIAAGQSLRIRNLEQVGLSPTPLWTLYSPRFTQISSSSLGDLSPSSPEPGFLYLVVRGNAQNPDPGGSIRISVTDLGTVAPEPFLGSLIDLDSTVQDSLPDPDSTLSYRFVVPGRLPVALDVLSESGQFWTLRDRVRTVVNRTRLRGADSVNRTDLQLLWLEPGEHQMSVTGAAGAFRFRWINAGSADLVPPSTPVSLIHDPANSIRLLQFDAQRDLPWIFNGSSQGFTRRPTYTLFAPSGRTLTWGYADSFNDVYSLPETGRYFLHFSSFDDEAGSRGTNSFQWYPALLPTPGIQLEQPFDIVVDQPGLDPSYRIVLDQPRTVLLDLLDSAPSVTVHFDHANYRIATLGANQADIDGSPSQTRIQLPAGESLLTFSVSGAATPSFRAVLRELISPRIVPFNIPFSHSHQPANASTFHSVPVRAGESYLFEGLGSSGYSSTAFAELFYPIEDGIELTALSSYSSRFTAPRTGNAFLHISGSPRDSSPSATHQFRLWHVIDQTNSLSLNLPVLGQLDQPSQNHRFTFRLNQPRRLLLDFLSNSSAYVRLSGPSGTVIDNLARNYRDSQSRQVFLAPPGDYSLTLYAQGLDRPNYAFRLLDVTDVPYVTPGVDTLVQFDLSRSTWVRRVQANAGDTFYFDTLAYTGFSSSSFQRFIGPDEEPLWQAWAGADAGPAPTVFTGDHYLVIHGPEFTEANPPQFRFRLVPVPPVTTESILGNLSLPDLVPLSLAVSPNPTSSGATLAVSWITSNQGNAPAASPFTDQVIVRNDSGAVVALAATNDVLTPLLPGQSRSRQLSVPLPDGPSATGTLTVQVAVDSAGNVRESNATGNAEANNVATQSVTSLLAPYPDLQVTQFRFPAGSWIPGSSVPLTWSTTNSGNLAAIHPFSERLVISNATRRVVLLDTLIPHPEPLPPGSASPRSFNFSLPISANAYGSFVLYLLTDAANNVAEFNADSSAELNNLATTTTTAAVDLAVLDPSLPSRIEPGVPFPVIHTITNQGLLPVAVTWQDSFTFIAQDDSEFSLGLRPVTSPIPPGHSIRLTNLFTLPVTFPHSSIRIAVTTDSTGVFLDSDRSNNRAEANPAFFPSILTLQPASSSIREDANPPTLPVTLSRSGTNSAPLVVSLLSSDPSEITTPDSITFAAGQSSVAFNLSVLPDGLNDGNQSVTLSASAPGFPPASVPIQVIDVDLTRITLSLSTNRAVEGSSIPALISRSPAGPAPLLVQIVASDSSQLLVPGSVVIPPNSASASFSVLAIDDDLVERTNSFTLTANAPGIPATTASLTVIDNDLPIVSASLAQRSVSEGAGPNATSLALTRSPVSSRPLLLTLASGNPTAARVPSSVIIPANQASISIPVAVFNNSIADGPRAVAFSGFILDDLSRLPVSEIIPDVLTVTDDDGPTLTLQLDREAVSEGLTNAAIGTVLRNTPADVPLSVSLSSSLPSEASVPASVIIPAGSDRVSFPIRSIADGVTDGNRSVLLTASAPGFVSGNATLVVSDADRPDLVIASIRFPTNVVGGETIVVQVRIENRGAIPVTTPFIQRLSLSTDSIPGNDILVGQVSFAGPLSPGASFDQAFSVRSPDQPGSYHLIAETDTSGVVDEILENNNLRVSPDPLVVSPAYTAVVETDVQTALAGSEVILRGQASRPSGLPAAQVPVSVHVSVRNLNRILPAVSGPDGRFQILFQPLPSEGGRYDIAAAHPGAPRPTPQDQFRLIGLAVVPLPRVVVNETSSVRASTTVENRTDIPLSQISAEVVTNHPSLRVRPSLSSPDLPGDGQLLLHLDIDALDTSATESSVTIRIRSAEGAESILTTRVRQEIRVPRLVATPGSLNTAMVRGRQTPVAFQLRNNGGIESGPVRVDLPPAPWLALSSPALIPSLPPGSNTVVTLLLTPSIDLPLGDYSSSIALRAERSAINVPASFRAISDGIGDLIVRTENEYTYFAEGNPPLDGATVVIRDALSGTAIRTNVTGIDGLVVFTNLTEAYYLVSANADRHRPFQQTVLVQAGAQTNLTAFLSRQAIRYSFFVEPTSINDSYSLSIESTFETQVPQPVVTIEPASIDLSRYPGDEFQIEITVRNHGLVAADSIQFQIPSNPRFSATPLVDNLGRLPAGAVVTVPILVRRLSANPAGGGNRSAAPALDDTLDDAACSIAAQALWSYLCGPNPVSQVSPFTLFSGCDDAELYTRVFEFREIPYWTQPGADPDVAAFINSLAELEPPGSPWWYSEMTEFTRRCRTEPLLGPLASNPRSAAIANDPAADPDRDVCARVSLRLSQSAVLARDAFRATLEVDNDTSDPLSDVLVDLQIRSLRGTNITDLFGIDAPDLTGFSSVAGDGSLAANSIGRSRWILVPSLDAAPTNGPVTYLVSGTLSYSQAGIRIAVPLAAAPISVFPQPELVVRYFHERDVFGDDPFTPQIEPSIPYSLAVQVLNVGFGEARGLRITSSRPQVVDNEKGLQIEFQTLGAQLENQPVSPSLDIDFGAIPAGTNRIARWLFSSSVQGSFTNFNASFQHTDALGARRLSLIRNVEIHELARIVHATSPQDHRPDFLVNAVPDPDLLPDTLFLSDGRSEPVVPVTDASLSPTGIPGEFQIAITPSPGWIYLRAQAPSDAGPLLAVLRPDGSTLPTSNFWITDRFIRGGELRPIQTNLFHLFDANPSGTYRLQFGDPIDVVPDLTPPSSRVITLAATVPVDFPVSWSGSDPDGSGIAHFDVFYSVDNGPLLPWLTRSSATSALFRGQPGRQYAFQSIATDAAGNREPARPTPDTTTRTVSQGNQPPAFTGNLDFTIDELSLLDGTLSASDPDPGQSLRFHIVDGAPAGFSLDTVSGRFLWRTSEADGPGSWSINVRVSDDGSPPESSTAVLRISVREVNQAPSINPPAPQLVTAGTLVTLPIVASDPDRPAQSLRFSLVSPPPGASIDPVSGLFSWRPRQNQGGVFHDISVRVSDNGSPALTAEATFRISVRDTASDILLIGSTVPVLNGNSTQLPIQINAPPDLAEIQFSIHLPPDRLSPPVVASLAPDVSAASTRQDADGLTTFLLQMRPGASILAARHLLNLSLQTSPSSLSLIVPVSPDSIVSRLSNGQSAGRSSVRPGRIIIVGHQPIATLDFLPSQTEALFNVYGPPGLHYRVEAQAPFQPDAPWFPILDDVIGPDSLLRSASLPINTGEAFYRVVEDNP
jgi:hypothetical protein